MGIWDRMSRALSAKANALLDKAEDPGKSLDLLLVEMSEAITAAKRELVSNFATEKQLNRKAAGMDPQIEKWATRAELAIRAGDEQLARDALAFKQRLQKERQGLRDEAAEAKARTLEMKSQMRRMEQKLGELKGRASSIKAQISQGSGGGAVEGLGSSGGRNLFDEFRQAEDALDGEQHEAAAAQEVDGLLEREGGGQGPSAAELDARFAKLEGAGGAAGGESVDRELEALKQRLRVK